MRGCGGAWGALGAERGRVVVVAGGALVVTGALRGGSRGSPGDSEERGGGAAGGFSFAPAEELGVWGVGGRVVALFVVVGFEDGAQCVDGAAAGGFGEGFVALGGEGFERFEVGAGAGMLEPGDGLGDGDARVAG